MCTTSEVIRSVLKREQEELISYISCAFDVPKYVIVSLGRQVQGQGQESGQVQGQGSGQVQGQGQGQGSILSCHWSATI